ncbi:MAG: glycosyltransferase family 4 protein [Planctomycetota bacterium]
MKRAVSSAIKQADCYILRAPGILSTLVWKHLSPDIPFGIEVVADPWDVFAPGAVPSPTRPFFRRQVTYNLKKQCLQAAAAAYVTEYSLQKRYPTDGWATHYSDVELPDDVIVDEVAVKARVDRTRAKAQSGNPWLLCYVGAISQLYKAPDILIEAVAECVKQGMNLELIMVGGGQLRAQLERRTETLRIAERAHFLGQLATGKDVFDQIDRADLFILPSRQEGLPRAMVEAMARASPCIGSTVGGFPELLDAEDMVPPGDVQALVTKIREVLDNPARMEQMSKRNLKTVNGKFRREELEQRWLDFYRKVADVSRAYHCRSVR